MDRDTLVPMSDTDFVFVKGKKIDQTKLRKFLADIDFENVDQFETPEGHWKSPITGELFRTKHHLWGHFGAYLRTIEQKDPREPTRAGYVRAVRNGLEPTPEQKKAHRDYTRSWRLRRRKKMLADRGIEVEEQDPPFEEPETEEPVKRTVPQMTWD